MPKEAEREEIEETRKDIFFIFQKGILSASQDNELFEAFFRQYEEGFETIKQIDNPRELIGVYVELLCLAIAERTKRNTLFAFRQAILSLPQGAEIFNAFWKQFDRNYLEAKKNNNPNNNPMDFIKFLIPFLYSAISGQPHQFSVQSFIDKINQIPIEDSPIED